MRFGARDLQSIENSVRVIFDPEQREIVYRVVDYDVRSEVDRFARNLYPNFLGILYHMMIGDDVTLFADDKAAAASISQPTYGEYRQNGETAKRQSQRLRSNITSLRSTHSVD
jgi:hypothetical protein